MGSIKAKVKYFTTALCVLIGVSSCFSSDTKIATKNILFVGNSLTYTNNLPELVEMLAKQNGLDVKTEMLAFPNYALEDHWNEGLLQKRIASKKFAFVVVQQGPSSQTDGKEMLLEYGSKIKSLCDKHHTKLAFFMVWPSKANYKTFDGVIANYSAAAAQTNSLICPAGSVWKERIDSTQDFSYYGPDNFHPSLEGSQATAHVIFNVLFNSK